MERKPRDPDEPILDRLRFVWIAIAGLIMAAGTLGIAWYVDDRHGDAVADRGADRVLHLQPVFLVHRARRAADDVQRREASPTAKFLFATGSRPSAIVLGTELNMLNRFIGTTGLTRAQWGVCLVVPLALIGASEAWKWYLRRRDA